MPSKTERLEAIERLRSWLKPGDTVYCILRSVSRSGMSRVISLKHIDSETGQIGDLSYNAHLAGVGSGYDDKREGLKVSGCGMDMGFAVVYDLAHTLWPKGYECPGGNCQSSEHQRPTIRKPCKSCDGRGTLDASSEQIEQDPHADMCHVCGGRGSWLDYGAEPPRGPGVIHKDAGSALTHRWL